MDALKELLSDFDINTLVDKLIPKLDTVLGWVVLLTRIAVMAAPLLILAFGLLYLLLPPKEANYSVGYRCWWGMASLDAWQFTQKLAGVIWAIVGLGLTVTMTVMSAPFADMAPMDMLWSAVRYIAWQLLALIAACFVINVTVFVMFDRKGYRRWERVQ